MDKSKFLSKVIGIYLIIISIAMLVRMQEFTHDVTKLINDAPLMFVVGFFTLILGILMVVSHNIWQWNWRVIVTIIGWITLLKGASIIFSLQFLDKAAMLFVQNINAFYIAAIIDLVLGVLLSYLGFKR
jgi:hypothetical protein